MRFLAGFLFVLATAGLLSAKQPVAPIATAQPNAQSNSPADSPQATANSAGSSGQAPAAAPGQQSSAQLPPNTVIIPSVTKREAAEAKKQFQAGLKLKDKGKLDDALDKFSSASELDPRNVDYITAREIIRQQLALEALKRGNKAMLDHNEIVAMAEFRRALQYDPTNDYALQRLRDALPDYVQPDRPVSVVERSTLVELQPATQHHDFHFRGDSRALLTELTRAYRITAEFDNSVKQRRVHFDIQDVNFATALQTASQVTKTFWVPLSATQIFILDDTVENRRNFERMALQTFYLRDVNDQQLAEITNSLRVLLNLRFISQNRAQDTITVRAEYPVLQAAEKLIKSITTGLPEILLDVRVYAVSANLARSLGTALPTQFTMFNISPALVASLGQNAQNLINQLIASGGINQANAEAIQALLAQLQNSATSSILSQPFVTFGGGLTLFGLTGGGTGVTPTFSLNTSEVQTLEHVTLRASHNNPAVMKIGQRYPIINATYAPIYNTASIAQVIGNQSYIAPVPSFNFEDLGINLKATPSIHGSDDVTLKMELQLRTLGGQNVNGIPIINNREYTGTITVKNGESSVMTGLLDLNDSRAINGYPFLSRVPGLSYGTSVHNKNVTEDELLVVVTPHVVRSAQESSFAVQLPPSH
jgi:general secretion pathway protein D